MDTVRLDELFEVKRGRSLNFEGLMSGDVSYVSSGSISNGVIGQVNLPVGFTSISPGVITVARSGSVGFAAYHDVPIFVNENAFYLTPKKEYEPEDLLYYVMVLRNNSKRFGYGRPITAPKLSALQLPAEPSAWAHDYRVDTILGEFDKAMVERETDVDVVDRKVDTSDWVEFRIGDLFEIKRGKSPSINRLLDGNTPVVSSREFDNGVAKRAEIEPTFEAGLITVAADGSVGFATVQPEPFVATGHVAVWLPREMSRGMSTLAKLGLCTLIRLEGPRYGFGRAWGIERMGNTHIRLPAVLDESGDVMPDWDRLDAKMRELAFSQYVVTGEL